MDQNVENGAAANEITATAHIIELGDSLDIGKIAELHQRLEAALELESDALQLNAKDIERIDAASLQLLTVFNIEAQKRGLKVRWNSPSQPLRDAADRVGLISALSLN